MNISNTKDFQYYRDSDMYSGQKTGTIGGGYKNQLSLNYDPSKPQFVPDETEIMALFQVFQKNGKINLEEFLDVLKKTGRNIYFWIKTSRC